MNSNALRNRFRLLVDSAPPDEKAFAHALVDLGRFALEELNGDVAEECRTEPQRRDLLRDLARFQSDQRVVDWAHANKIVLPKGVFWWWCNDDDCQAEIVGLPNSLGLPRITNGIDVWIELQDGNVFLGHRDNLKWHRKPSTRKESSSPAGTCTSANGKSKVVEAHRKTAEMIIANRTFDAFAAKFLATVGKPPTMLVIDEDNLESEELVASLTQALEEYFKCVAMQV